MLKTEKGNLSVGDVLLNRSEPILENGISREQRLHKLSFSISVLIVQLYKYSAYLYDAVALKIRFHQPAYSHSIKIEYSLSIDDTFLFILKQVKKEIKPALKSCDLDNLNADIHWITGSDEENSFYRCQIGPVIHNGLSNVCFSCSSSAFFQTVFRNAEVHYKALADYALAYPLSHVKDMSYLSGDQFNEIESVAYGPVDKQISTAVLLHELFERAAEQFPDSTAVVYGNQSLSYKELNAKANRLAHYLIQNGVKPGDFIGILLNRSPEIYIAMLGILKAGAAYVPLDTDYPEDRVRFILEDASVRHLISNSSFKNSYCNYSGTILNTDKELLPLLSGSSLSLSEENQKVLNDDGFPAYVIYTSGTTGRPKGVVIPHSSVSNLVKAEKEIFAILPCPR